MDTTSLVLALLLSVALTLQATESLQACPAATVAEEGRGKKFVERRGTQFVVDDVPFYVNGFNTYWLMVFAADESTRNKVQQVFKQASSVGLTVARTWAFNDGGWRALQKSPGVYDEQVFQALDYVINEASKHNIRLVLTLSNNWDAYGGKCQYVKWGKSAGVANLTSDDAFFTDTTLKSYFKSYVTTVLNRVNTISHVSYKDDPAIMAWELMNEPRCPSDPSGDALDSWIKEMAFHIKGVDSNHLLTTGLEGFYGPSSTARANDVNPNTYAAQVGTDFLRHHSALGIDFASVHVYADTWVTANTVSESHIAWAKKWTTAHVEDADKVLGMPVLFGEFGVSAKDKGYNVSFRNRFYQTVYDAVLGSIREGGAGAGSLVWQIFPEGVEYMDDGYALVLSTDNSTASLVSRQSSRLSLFNKLCNMSCKWKCKKRSSEVSEHRHADDLELEL